MRLGVVAEQRLLFLYGRGASAVAAGEPDRLLLVTKHVYPDVARCFDTNWKCVERGLRRATNVAWNTAPEKLSELAHRHLTEKPSVSELLSLLTIYLRAEEEN